jgi:hypothetical protein
LALLHQAHAGRQNRGLQICLAKRLAYENGRL